MKSFVVLATAVALAAPVAADDLFDCGTSPEVVEWVRGSSLWSQQRVRAALSKGLKPASAALRDNLFIVPSDDYNSPWRHPFDLQGRSLRFRRQGTTGFAVSSEELQYDSQAGTEIITNEGGGEYASVPLDFDFPFFDRTVRTIYVTDHNAIFADVPDAPVQRQYGDLDLVTDRRGIIAPLFTTNSSQFGARPSIRARRTADSITLSWSAFERYDIQAVLFRSGDILFSYREVRSSTIAASGIVVSSGNESWRNDRGRLGGVDDPSNDQRNDIPEPVASQVDITSVEVNRIGSLDLYEVRINTRGAIERTTLPSGETLAFTVSLGTGGTQGVFRYTLSSTTESYSLTGWSPSARTPAARVEGSTVVMSFLAEHIAGGIDPTVRVTVSRNGSLADSATTFGPLTPSEATRRVRSDLSAASGAIIDSRPIVEAFSLPVVNVGRIWEQIKEAEPTLRDDDVDGVFIYQDHDTDIITYAGAYSTGGNSRAIGLAFNDTIDASLPRFPALMHMNKIGYGWNASTRNAVHVVLHEFGHRWLLFASIMENGARTRVLNPVSAHPAQYVFTPAAFNVFTDADASVMGGGIFRDNGNGTFDSGEQAHYGFSWLDLYLMGLAAPSEVQPFFYIADSSPALGQEYYAPPARQYQGTRREVTIDQVIAATGKRSPEYPDTQRQFRTIFVLLTNPDQPVTENAIKAVQDYRFSFESGFRVATGGRAEASTTVLVPYRGPRRRSTGR